MDSYEIWNIFTSGPGIRFDPNALNTCFFLFWLVIYFDFGRFFAKIGVLNNALLTYNYRHIRDLARI